MSDFSAARQNMVDCQVRTSDVTDSRVVDAMLAVPREVFVPERRRALAYLDLDLAVTENGAVRRVLLKPAVTARLLQAAGIRASDRVLVAGCASGYTAALAAKLADRVIATDPDAALVARANTAFAQLAITNATALVADVAEGAAVTAPYDVIVLDGATEIVPQALYAQLSENTGRLVGIFSVNEVPRATIVKRSRDDFGTRILFDAYASVLPGLQRTPEFTF